MQTKKHYLTYLYLLIILTAIVIIPTYSYSNPKNHHQEITPGFRKIFIFGDSLSDNGNLWRTSSRLLPPGGFPDSPPYYAGRFSNYKVWSEILTDYLKAPEFNYAFGGATITKGMIFYPIPTITKQVDAYINSTAAGDPNALYIIWAGANDITMNMKFAEDYAENTLSDLPNKMLSILNNNINKLLNHGAKKFLLLPIPYLVATPNSLKKAQDDKHYLAKIDYLVQKYNQGFYNLVNYYVSYSQNYQLDLKFISFDTYSFLKDTLNRASEYGFTNVTGRCNPNPYGHVEPMPRKPICYNPDQYLFWDGTHPSYAANNILAGFIINQIQQAGYKANDALLEPSTDDLYSYYLATRELDRDLFGGDHLNRLIIKFYKYFMQHADVAFY